MKLSRLGQMARVFKVISPEGQSWASNTRLPLCSVYLLKRRAFIGVGAGGDFFRQAAPQNHVRFHPTIAPSVVPAWQAGGATGWGCGPLLTCFWGVALCWSCLAAGSSGPGMGDQKIPSECDKCRDWVEPRRGPRHRSDQETEGRGSLPPVTQLPSGGAPLPFHHSWCGFPWEWVFLLRQDQEASPPTSAPSSTSKLGSPQQQPSVSLISPRCHPPSL